MRKNSTTHNGLGEYDPGHLCIHKDDGTSHKCRCKRTRDHWELYRAYEKPAPDDVALF